MTIALRAAGAWAAGSTAPAPTIPAGTTTGDIMLLYVGCKPYSATINTPSGWTLITGTDGQNGTVASGVDVGSVRWAIVYRLWLSGDANPTISVTSGNVSLAVIISFSKTLSSWATPAGAKGSDTSSGTAFSLTMDANPGITLDDMLVTFATIAGNNATFGTPTLTATGATIGTVTESPATEGSTATGNDLESSASQALCTAGTATAAPVVGWTLSVAQTGGGALARLRETAGTQFDQPVSGTLTFAGAFTKSGQKPVTGGLTFSTTHTKQGQKAVTGGLTFNGAVTKQTVRAVSGALTFVGGLTTLLLKTIAFTASLAFSSVFVKRTEKAVAGNLSFTGAIAKTIQKVVAGVLTFAGDLTAIKQKLIAFTASLTFSGSFTKQAGKVVAANLSFLGAILQKKAVRAGRAFLFTAANWGTQSFYLEVFMRATEGTVEAELYNVTDGVTVAGSNVSTSSATLVRLRSGALTLVNGKEYRLQLLRLGSDGGSILGGQIIAV